MHPHEGDPRRSPASDTAPDRRRPGRPSVTSPQLIPLLRGQLDPEAPADPNVGNPFHRDLVIGVAIASTLLIVGALLRYAA